MDGTPDPIAGSTVLDTEPTNTPDQFSFRNATFEEVLEELSSRFILNLPEDELAEVERVCFQVEQAHWYYEDFIRDEKPSLPSLPLKKFSEILFRSCPLLHHWSHDHETAFNDFMSYKTRVPVCGAIMLNESLTKCVLVKGWKSSAGWGFPKGKVNENEDEALCAVREVLEETGYNLTGQIRRKDCIRLCIKQQPITLFVVSGISEDFLFKTQTRKEISKIDWFKLADLPTWKKNTLSTNKFYLITPVIVPLKVIVRTLRKARKAARHQHHTLEAITDVSMSNVNSNLKTDDAVTDVESPVTIEPSSHSQSGEASSSQSSSIDPHTPSTNGDLAPHTSDNALVIKQDFLVDAEDIASDMARGVTLATVSSSLNADSRSHWSRLMTRLNHSEESSPRGTPHALTHTLPVPPDPTGSESQVSHKSPSTHNEVADGNISVRSSSPAANNASTVPTCLAREPSPVCSFPFGLEASTPEVPFGSVTPLHTTHQPPSSTDVFVKRTRQLQLLDSVLAEESAKRTPQPASPMPDHILGAYSTSSSGSFLNHVRTPIRPASVIADNLSIPTHHYQPRHSVSTLSDVLPSVPSASLSHQFARSQSHLPSPILTFRGNIVEGRPATALPSSIHSGHVRPNQTSPLTATVPYGSHRGQMLSILSGGTSTLRHSISGSLGSGFRPASATNNTGSVSTSVAGAANVHLLSILNNPSAPPVSVRARK